MKLEIVLIGLVLFVLIAAIAVKQWEAFERRKYEAGLKLGDRRIFSKK